MALFKVTKKRLQNIRPVGFRSERELQTLVEQNLKAIFNSRLIGSEHPTGIRHAGRIDTLALSEDDNPVIIEYKKAESSTLINQSLFYLSWLEDHRGDFEALARTALGPKCRIAWDEIRVICIAPSFTKYDLHAVQSIGRSIELWTYVRYKNQTIQLEAAFGGLPIDSCRPQDTRSGSQAHLTSSRRRSWTFQDHLSKSPVPIQELMLLVQEFMLSLDEAIEESPKKFYIAYRTTQNIVCVEPQKKKLTLFVKLDPKSVALQKGLARDVTGIGHFGTGNLELTVRAPGEFDSIKPLLKRAFECIGR